MHGSNDNSVILGRKMCQQVSFLLLGQVSNKDVIGFGSFHLATGLSHRSPKRFSVERRPEHGEMPHEGGRVCSLFHSVSHSAPFLFAWL